MLGKGSGDSRQTMSCYLKETLQDQSEYSQNRRYISQFLISNHMKIQLMSNQPKKNYHRPDICYTQICYLKPTTEEIITCGFPCLKQDHVLAHRRTSLQGYQSLEQFHMLMTAKDFRTGVVHCPPVKTNSR